MAPCATAAGDDSSASVIISRLSMPRYPDRNGDGSPGVTEVKGAHSLGGDMPPSNHSRH